MDLQGLHVICIVFSEDLTYCTYCETVSFQAEQGAEHLRKYTRKYETGELFPKEGSTYVLVNVSRDCIQFLQIKQS